MTAQLNEISKNLIEEVFVPEFFTKRVPVTANQQVTLHKWCGAANLAHSAVLNTFLNTKDKSNSDSALGRAATYIATSGVLSELPASAFGHKLNEMLGWFNTNSGPVPSEDRTVTLSGSDIKITVAGNLYIQGIGDTGVSIGHENPITKVVVSQSHSLIKSMDVTVYFS